VPLIPILSILASFGLMAFREKWAPAGDVVLAQDFPDGVDSASAASLVGSGMEKR
jgi:hypothetical protein